jgi:hypothetical protein
VRSEDLSLTGERPQEVVRIGLELVIHQPRPDASERLELLGGASHTNEDPASRNARGAPLGTGRFGVGLTNRLCSLSAAIAVFGGRDVARSDCTCAVASCRLILGPGLTARQAWDR